MREALPNSHAHPGWRFWIDRGGTFTDVIALAPDRRRHVRKLLSEAPDRYDDAVLAAVREILGLAPGAAIPEGAVAELRVGTTLTTNALLEGKTAAAALLVNRGFGDLLRIGDQSRPELFRLAIERPAPLYQRVIEIDARIDAAGRELTALDPDAVTTALAEARSAGCESLAIALAHCAQWPAHEAAIAELARAAGFTHICCSHEISALPGLLDRARTALVEAALAPMLDAYKQKLRRALPGTLIRFMQSSGGLADLDRFRARDSVFSGPAGGVIGATRVAGALGIGALVGFDMGGTSTDVFHHDGELERQNQAEVAGQLLRVPMLSLHTVAAGGGSRIRFDGERLRVGPESAGADPGPTCYGRGGPLTITDANVLLGRVRAESFPPMFGEDGRSPLDADATRRGFERLAAEINRVRGTSETPEALAWGALAIATENMANAVRRISVRRGIDLAGHSLCSFGGAGPQHACAVADSLGIDRVLVPSRASVLSALGIGLSDLLVMREVAVERVLSAEDPRLAPEALRRHAADLEHEALASLRAQGLPPGIETRIETRLRLRYRDAERLIEVPPAESVALLREAFEAEHRRQAGYADAGRDIELVALIVRASGGGAPLDDDTGPGTDASRRNDDDGEAEIYLADTPDAEPGWRRVPRLGPPPTGHLDGPAMVDLDGSSFLLLPGWRLVRTAHGLLAERRVPLPRQRRSGSERDPVRLEIINNRFVAIAEQMGEALQRSAHSVNVRERLDYSCALFDARGQLLANAPHIPVHLGSMGEAVRTVIRGTASEAPREGDAWLLNDPYAGGTHLPDLTVISPALGDDGQLIGYVASRAHHADVGGISPGSMPAHSRHIDEEGVLFSLFHLVRDGDFDETALRTALTAGHWPSRNVEANVADLRAQVAANRRGIDRLRAMAATFGAEVVQAYMGHVQDAAEEAVRRRLREVREGRHALRMDNGAEVRVQLRPRDDGLVIDFAGTSPQGAHNFHAPTAVVRAAALYVLRCLIDDDIPLNEGCLRAVELLLPEASLLSPVAPAAVVAGNVETSQCVVDALLGALRAQAGSQGTMNNLSFGDARHQYYETVCGGAGAGPGFDGASAVHTHMTNSRITDVEILERRFPVLLQRFSIRAGSGGGGRWQGGDGVHRVLRFLSPMEVALLGNHRQEQPRGLEGGLDAAPGRNLRLHADGREEVLPASAAYRAEAGETLSIETPGGGGYGAG